MLFKKLSILLLATIIGCTADYGVSTSIIEEILLPDGEVVVDSLIQASRSEQIDVLVLLDTSCSMNDNYNQVSIGVELLRNDLNNITNDYNIAFINTSLMEPYFVGTFDNTTPIIDFIIAPWTLGGDTVEAGFTALYDFTRVMPESVGFFRETADKLFIFVSDEEEQGGIPVDIFEDWLKTEFKDVQRDVVSIVTIPEEESDCETPDYSATVGERYAQLARYYGKDAIDICSDWELWLSDSTFLTGPVNVIKLSQTPVKDSIKVYINKIEIEDWYYLVDTNTVHLEVDSKEGDLVEVGYVVLVDE